MPLFKSKEEKELERRMQAKQGRTRIMRHIEKQKQAIEKYWELGKRALTLSDDKQFRTIGAQYLWTQNEITRWERYLLTLDTIEARRDQAASVTEFVKSLKALTESMMAQASPSQIAKMQKDLELGLARAETVQERLDLLMEMTDETLSSSEGSWSAAGSGGLDELKQAMASEASHSEADARIDEGLKKLAEQMRKEKQ
jgi:hypothetical protein